MRLFRYRKPSIKTAVGYTSFTRRGKRALGISQVEAVVRPSRVKQKIKYKAGLYSAPARAVRQTSRGKFRTFFGLFK